MFFGFSNQPKRGGPPVVKRKAKPMSFGMGFGSNFGNPGKTKLRKNSMNKGDWDRDGVSNMFDCRPMNFRKQDYNRNQEIIDSKLKKRFKPAKEEKNTRWLLHDGEKVDTDWRAHNASARDVITIKNNPSRGTGKLSGNKDNSIRAMQLGAGAIRTNISNNERTMNIDLSAEQKVTEKQKEVLREIGKDKEDIYYEIRKDDTFGAGEHGGMATNVDDVLEKYEELHEESKVHPSPETLQSLEEENTSTAKVVAIS